MIYLHLSSEDSITLFPQNTNVSFICELPDTINLTDAWECALVDISGDLTTEYNVFCDIVEYNVIKGTRLPIIRTVSRRGEFQHLQFVKVRQPLIKHIYIYITDKNLKLLKKSGRSTFCTLCLRRCG